MQQTEKDLLVLITEFQYLSERFNKFADNLNSFAFENTEGKQKAKFEVEDYLVLPVSMRKK